MENGWVVEAVWRNTSYHGAETQVLKKIEKYGTGLTQWSRRNFGHVRKEIASSNPTMGEATLNHM